jgi:hypothetical protein
MFKDQQIAEYAQLGESQAIPRVEQELNMLSNTIDELFGVTSVLGKRLHTVLTPVGACGQEKTDSQRCQQSPLTSVLEEKTERLRTLVKIVGDFVDRLEV